MREKTFLCRVYICNKRVEVENVLHLLFYIYMEKEKAKEDVLGGRTSYL